MQGYLDRRMDGGMKEGIDDWLEGGRDGLMMMLDVWYSLAYLQS